MPEEWWAMMSKKLARWWNEEFRPSCKSDTSSSHLLRQIAKVVGYLILAAFCLFVVWRIRLASDVNSKIARIRAAGFPLSGAELNAWHAVPDAENGALVMTQALALLRTFPDARSNEVLKVLNIPITNKWSVETRDLVGAFVKTNAPALAKAQEAFLMSRFRYPVDFSYGLDSKLPHLEALREMANVSLLEAELDAEEGRADAWPESVTFALKLAGTLDAEPNIYSHVIRNSIIDKAAGAVEQSLNRFSPSAEACQSLDAAFTRAGATNSLPLAFVGERAQMLPLFRMSWKELQSESQSDGSPAESEQPHRYLGQPAAFLSITGLEERDLNFYLQTMDKCISLAALPLPSSLELTNYLDSSEKIAKNNWEVLSMILLGYSTRPIVSEAYAQAYIRLATVALAVERFRLEQNRLPGDLKQLTPRFLAAVPMDPFDGAPLRYRRLTRGYVVYSVGADGHDDGGREPPEIKKITDKTTYDITFIVER